MTEWKDTSSYSQSDKEHIPNIWSLYVPGLRISVIRAHRYCPDSWCLTCAPWFDAWPLKLAPTVENRDAAMAKAVEIVRKKLQDAIKELPQ